MTRLTEQMVDCTAHGCLIETPASVSWADQTSRLLLTPVCLAAGPFSFVRSTPGETRYF